MVTPHEPTPDRYTLYATIDGAQLECHDCGWTTELPFTTNDCDDRITAVMDALTGAQTEHNATHRKGL
jgi:hypothetical protein